jgi:hypothetical protein
MRDRMLRKDYWDDEKVGGLSIQAKCIFPLMWNIADDLGILEYCPSLLARKIVLSIEEVIIAINELTVKGFLIDYQKPKAKRLLIITNFLIHQVINRPSPSKELTNEEFILIQKKHNENHFFHVIEGGGLKNTLNSMNLSDNSVKNNGNSVLNEMNINEYNINKDNTSVVSKDETTNKTEHLSLFGFWNDLNIIKHTKLNDAMKKAMDKIRKEYSIDLIQKAMTNYAKILKSTDHFFKYKWNLWDFLNFKNISKFIDDSCYANFKIKTPIEEISRKPIQNKGEQDGRF